MKKNTPSKVVHLLKLVTARAQALQKCINKVCTRLAIEPDEQILAVMEDIGNQVGRVIKDKVDKVIEVLKNLFEAQLRESGLKEIQPEDVIEPEFLDFYTEHIVAIWKQVVKLNSNVYCLKRIEEFPFDLFEPGKSTLFWILVKDSMFETSVMVICRILIDKDNDGRNLTLEGLKDKIVCNLTDEKYKEQFKKVSEALKDLKDCQFGELEKRMKKLRDKYYAHFDRAFNINVSDEDIKKRAIFLKEIYELTEYINSFSQLLHFGRGYSPIYLDYHSEAEHPSDIEILLDTIAEKSVVMNMPEKDPEKWLQYRKKLHDSKIEILNQYRKKSQLPPA